MTHHLKIKSDFFQSVVSGEKTFEIRKDDRHFNVGDYLVLHELDDFNQFTGFFTVVLVTYILRNCSQYGLVDGFCILSFISCFFE